MLLLLLLLGHFVHNTFVFLLKQASNFKWRTFACNGIFVTVALQFLLHHMECLHTAAAAAVRGAGRCHDNTVRPHRAKSLSPFVATVLSQTVSCSGDSGQVCLRVHAGHAPYGLQQTGNS